MHIGFTGTRRGMTGEQRDLVLLHCNNAAEEGDTTVHHGDCVGADYQFHEIAYRMGYLIEVHPQNADDSQRAYAHEWFRSPTTWVHPAKRPMDRNHDIVHASRLMIATPGEQQEMVRSGTWATVRYAKRFGVRMVVLLPDGTEYWFNDG